MTKPDSTGTPPHEDSVASISSVQTTTNQKKRKSGIKMLLPPTINDLTKCRPRDVYPGKKGGEYNFSGASLTFPSGIFQRKESVVTGFRVVPTENHLHPVPLEIGERVCGPVYKFISSSPLSKQITVVLPCFEDPDPARYNRRLKWLPQATADNSEPPWSYLEDFNYVAKNARNGARVEFTTDFLGTFVLTSTLKVEIFEITFQGALYNSRLNPYVNFRFPKKYLEKQNITWQFRIWPLNKEMVKSTAAYYKSECQNFVSCSDFFEVVSDDVESGAIFKRAVTIHLPLPSYLQGDEENNSKRDDLTVLARSRDGSWKQVAGEIRYTRDAATFDVKSFTMFVIAQSIPNRTKQLVDAMPCIYRHNKRIRGDIVTFLCLQKKKWHLWVEGCPLGRRNHVIEKRKQQAYLDLQNVEYVEPERTNSNCDVITPFSSQSRFSIRKPSSKNIQVEEKPPMIEFEEGSTIVLDIEGDVDAIDGDNNSKTHSLTYNETAEEFYRIFELKPKTEDEKKLEFDLIVSIPRKGGLLKTVLRRQTIEISESATKEYFYVEPDPEPKKMEIDITIPEESDDPVDERQDKKTSASTQHKESEGTKVIDRHHSDAFIRLTTLPKHKINRVSKEPRVLNGKSLQLMSKVVSEGLSLAVFLNIPDSTITGIGFDALSNGMTLHDVTYKILLTWKRNCLNHKNEHMVDDLVSALREMKKYDLADAIIERNQANKELTRDCLGGILKASASNVGGVKGSSSDIF